MKAKAVVFSELGRAEIQEVELPELGPEDIEVTTLCSGVSAGTEKNMLTGGNYAYFVGGERARPFPTVPGYQQIGTVTRVGDLVEGYEVGQRVYSHFWGYPVELLGIQGKIGAGAHMAAKIGPGTQSALKASQQNGLERLPALLPEPISDQEASLLSTASIGLHMAKRAPVRVGDNVLVLGLGIIGQFTAQAARALGGTVTAVDRMPERLDLATSLGAHRVVNIDTPDAWGEIATGGPYDVVLETTGLNAAIDEVLERSRYAGPTLLRRCGSIVVVAGRFKMEYNYNPAQRIEAGLLHARHHTDEDFHELLDYWKSTTIRIAPLITHSFMPDEAPSVYRMIVQGLHGWLGIVIKWQ